MFADRIPDVADEPEGEGADLLDQVADFLARYVAFPSPAARDAVALWAAHCHAVAAFESTPRLALLSPEKGSGKTRTLEVLELLVPRPMHAVNATAAALFRAVEAHRPTLLFDECDTYFGPMARGDHEELRGLVNAGHRKGAVAYRCVGDPKHMQVKAFPAFCAVAVAGIGDLPATILDRAILVRMRRRAPTEHVEPFRRRKAAEVGDELHKRLAEWMQAHAGQLADAEPAMPPGLVDRPADVWEALLAIADQAGGTWPRDARKAALELNAARVEADPSLGVALLRDLRAVFAIRDDGAVTGWHDQLATEELLKRLHALDESPWGAMPGKGAGAGKPMDARGLARRLRPYEVRPTTIRLDQGTAKGYRRGDLHDPWTRYLPDTPEASVTEVTPQASGVTSVTDVTHPGEERGALFDPDDPRKVHPMSEPDRLPVDEQYVLCHWSVEALADELKVSFDAAADLLEAAYAQGRVQILGNSYFAGVQCDGRWLVVEGRARLTLATREWQTLRAMERQLED